MRGQISIDYYAAVIIFVIIVVYFVFQIMNIVPRFISQMEHERMRSESYQISEILVNDAGLPIDWNNLVLSNPSAIQRIGFSDQTSSMTNVMSSAKADALNTLCSTQGQEFVRSKLNTEFQFSLVVLNRDTDMTVINCLGPSTDVDGRPTTRGFVATTTRVFSFANGEIGHMTLEVWKP